MNQARRGAENAEIVYATPRFLGKGKNNYNLVLLEYIWQEKMTEVIHQ